MSQEAVRGLKFTVRHADGRGEQMVVDSDQVLIGSGAHCEIRLPAAEAAVEHVALNLVAGGIHAQARALQPLPTINGSGFMQTPVAEGSVLGIGKTQITVEVVEITDNPNVIRKKQEKTSPFTVLMAILAFPLAYYILFGDEPEDRTVAPPKDVPVLWSAAVDRCPQAAADQANNLAVEKKVIAEGKRERRPFYVQDGVAAVPLFETAAACFRAGSSPALAKEMADAASTLRRQIEEDYRAHQVRLEHALAVNDLKGAQKEVKVLRALLEAQSGAYVVWLSNLDRKLQVKLGRKES